MDSISETRLNQVFPLLAQKIHTLAETLAATDIDIRVTQGFRTWAEQDALYAQGRTTPGKIVTNCPGGHSYHCYGLAVDCVPSQFHPGQPFNPDWNNTHPDWLRMESIGQTLGLESGATWRSFPDAPHFQLQGRFRVGSPDDEVRQIYQNEGMAAVWNEVSKSLGF